MSELIIPAPTNINPVTGPSLLDIHQARESLGDKILTTPVWQMKSYQDVDLWLKLELFQYTGSFKIRGALLGMFALSAEQKINGVIAVSAGNHGIAVAYAANLLNISAKILMPKTASPIRIKLCKDYGAEVLLCEDVQQVFCQVEEIQKNENRTLIHPFSGKNVALGTGTLGVELCRQVDELDALIVAIGGGGLISGIANAYKQLQPNIKIYGVEPEGAAVMASSFAMGQPAQGIKLHTIADSLATPHTEIYPFSLCHQFVDGIVKVADTDIIAAVKFLFHKMKLAVEPAAAIGIAALNGPLRNLLSKKRVGIIISGTNIDEHRYCSLMQ